MSTGAWNICGLVLNAFGGCFCCSCSGCPVGSAMKGLSSQTRRMESQAPWTGFTIGSAGSVSSVSLSVPLFRLRGTYKQQNRAALSRFNALATVRRFNARLSAKGYSWFWPKIKAALVSKHHWLVIACDSCDSVVDLDLRVKPRDPEASIRVALRDVNARAATGMAGRASLRWRRMRRSEKHALDISRQDFRISVKTSGKLMWPPPRVLRHSRHVAEICFVWWRPRTRMSVRPVIAFCWSGVKGDQNRT